MPALAIAGELSGRGIQVVLVGARRGVEADILPKRDYPFHLLHLEPIHRHRWWLNLRWPFLAVAIMRECRAVLDREAPDLVVGTGGYAAGPVLLAAMLHGLPYAMQEQNAYPGVTTRWLSRRARQIHLGFPEARGFLRAADDRLFDTGNPIAPVPVAPRSAEQARTRWGLAPDRQTVLVVGGSQGAAALNRVVAEWLERGSLGSSNLIWSTGPTGYDRYAHLDSPGRVKVAAFLDPIYDAYAATDLVVGRAGAMTTAELAAWGLPAVLIPLPTAAAGHQDRNARALEAAGCARRLPESELALESLSTTVSELLGDRSQLVEMGRRAAARGRPDAASKIVSQLVDIVS